MHALPLRLRLLWMTQHNRKQEGLASKHVSLSQDFVCQVCSALTFLMGLRVIQFALKGFKD